MNEEMLAKLFSMMGEERDYNNLPEDVLDFTEANAGALMGMAGQLASFMNANSDSLTPGMLSQLTPSFSRIGNAATANDPQSLEKFLKEGDNPNGNGGATPLLVSLLNGAVEACEILLKHNARADITWIKTPEAPKIEVPFECVMRLSCTVPEIPRSAEILSLLLKYKKYSQDDLKEAFFICMEYDNINAARALITSKKLSANFRDERNNPILTLCSTIRNRTTSREFIRILVENGADVNALDRHGNTVVSGIAGFDHDEVESLRIILESGKFNLIDKSNVSKSTALHFAAVNGNHRCVASLLKHRANPELKDSLGNTPWVLAEAAGAKKAQHAIEKHLEIGKSCFYPECKSKKGEDFKYKRCARCKYITYCCATCQRAHWPTHKLTCRPPQMVMPK